MKASWLSSAILALCLVCVVGIRRLPGDLAGCAKNVNKTCADLYGAWPPDSCDNTPCANVDECYVEEAPSFTLTVLNQNQWNNDNALQAVAATPATGGNQMANQVTTKVCALSGRCLLPCKHDIVLGNVCEVAMEEAYDLIIWKFNNVIGPCQIIEP